MNLSVVVPTLNGRDRLEECLDALAEHARSAEVVVVNGPSTDGTTGMVRDRDDVATLIEISDRNLNVARNAGIAAARGDTVAFVSESSAIEPSWLDAIRSPKTPVTTGPIHRRVRAGMTTESPESCSIAGRQVDYFDGGNVVFDGDALEAIDGFDEYLETGGARDVAHRLAAQGHEVQWNPEASVIRDDDERPAIERRDWGWKYRSLSYRMMKNYGPRPTVLRRTASHAGTDGMTVARGILSGDVAPSEWLGCGRDVAASIAIGYKDGLLARARDRSRPAIHTASRRVRTER